MKTLFGEREKKIAHDPVNQNGNAITQIARQLFAMAQKKTEANLVSSLRNERYQRTFTDEYTFALKPLPRFKKVDEEQRQWWARLAAKNAPTQKLGFARYTTEQLVEIYRKNVADTQEAAE